MFTPPPETIQLDRLLIRRETERDADAVARAIERNIVRLRPWMRWAVAETATADTQRTRIADARAQWDTGEMYDYALVDPTDNTFLGKIGLHRRIGPGALELGYWLDGDAEGKGIASMATSALTDAALALEDVERVEIHCDAANLRSSAVPQRLGYKLARIETQPIAAASETGKHMIWVYPG